MLTYIVYPGLLLFIAGLIVLILFVAICSMNRGVIGEGVANEDRIAGEFIVSSVCLGYGTAMMGTALLWPNALPIADWSVTLYLLAGWVTGGLVFSILFFKLSMEWIARGILKIL